MGGITKTKKEQVRAFVDKHISNKKFMQDYIIRLHRSLREFSLSIKRLKEQHKRDHRIIQIIKNEFPNQFGVCLSKYQEKYGINEKIK